jgi:mRNA interferase RelE/StbE
MLGIHKNIVLDEKEYPGKYKIRIGQYRIGITIDKQEKILVCNRIAHRKEIYRFFP